MSLNDPHWGRKGSEDDSSQKENEIKEPPKETDEEPRKAEPSKNEMPGRFAQNNNDGDLEELWKQFNDRLNSMLGTKGNQNRNAQKEEPSASSQTQNQKNFFLERNIAAIILATTERMITIRNPHGVLENGIPAALRFIPYALKTIVGILITMVITARTFMTMFRLLEITDAKVPIILLRIPL